LGVALARAGDSGHYLNRPERSRPQQEVAVSYESSANPIKLGYLMDFVLPAEYPQDKRLDLTQSLDSSSTAATAAA
jgi:hypothetical protein